MTTPRVCVIAAADGGVLRQRAGDVPTVLVDVAGKPLLTRQLELARDELGIGTVYLVVGRSGERIRAAYGDGRDLRLDIRYLDAPASGRGPGAALLAAEPHVQEPFVFLLGQECYFETNLRELPRVEGPYVAVCGLLPTEDAGIARGRYGVSLDGDRITGVVAPPGARPSPYDGCGAYVFTPALYRFAHETPPDRVELSDVLDRAARSGADLRPFIVRGHCAEVTSIRDRNVASCLWRSLHFERHRVSVVVPAYNEAASIAAVLRDFAPHVSETLVVDNCSPDGTADIARGLGATVISRPTRGFGDAVKQGLDAARGDILVMVEADGTFRAKDLGKLLEFLKDADMVVGTRTTRELIEPGANMDGLLRLANVLWGKIIEVLWWNRQGRYTDVGCSYRAFWRDAYLEIRDFLVTEDAAFLPETVVEMMRAGRRVIEIPVNYHRRRAGESKYSGTRWRSARTGLEMLGLILRRRLGLS